MLLLPLGFLAFADTWEGDDGEVTQAIQGRGGEEFTLRPGGYFESRNQVRTGDPGDPLSLRQRLRLELLGRRGGWTVFVGGRFDYDPAFYEWDEGENALRAELHEAYIGFDSGRFDLSIGQKMVRWGAADRLDPLDLINPLDVLDPIDDARHEERLPVWLGHVVCSFPRLTLEGVFIPRAEVNEFPEPQNPWEPALLGDLRKGVARGAFSWDPTDRRDRWFEDSETGFRASTFWRGVDIDLIYFNGYMDTPVIARDLSGLFDVKVEPRYDPFQAIGCAFAKGFDLTTLRGEISFKPDYSFSIDLESPGYFSEDDGVVKRDLYQGVLGVDRILLENIYVHAQAYLDRIEDGFHTLRTDTENYGAGYEVSGDFRDDDLTAGCRGVISASDEGAVSELFVRQRWGDNWINTFGVIWFDGSAASTFGQYDENDMFYLTVRRHF